MKEIFSKIKDAINKIVVKIGDKKAHVLCSFLITLITGFILGIIPGLVIGCVAGLGKEIYDEFKYRKSSEGVGFDRMDLIYDVVGIIIATITLTII